MKSYERFSYLLHQYQECLSFIRNFNSTIWQLPSLTMAINSFLAISYLGYARTTETRVILLLASFCFTFVSTIQLKKHRFLQEAKGDEFRWIQNELTSYARLYGDVRKIHLRTSEILKDKDGYPTATRGWWIRRGAYHWFLCSMYATLLTIITLLVLELGNCFFHC